MDEQLATVEELICGDVSSESSPHPIRDESTNSFNSDRYRNVRENFTNVNSEEIILTDYSCALKKDIMLIHGRMFIGYYCMYFHSNILGFTTSVQVNWKDIVEIKREKIAKFLSNAIQLFSANDKWFFASFAARDRTYFVMNRVWKNSICNERFSKPKMSLIVNSLAKKSSFSDESCLDLAFDTMDKFGSSKDIVPSENCDDTSLNYNDRSLPSSSSDFLQVQEQSDIIQNSTNSGIFPETINASIHCEEDFLDDQHCCPKFAKEQILSEMLLVSVDSLNDLLFNHNSPVMKKFCHVKKLLNFTCIDVEPDDDNSSSKIVSYALPVGFMGKDILTKTHQTFYQSNQGQSHISVVSRTSFEGIPYGESFEVVITYCLKSVGNGFSQLRVALDVEFIKNSLWGITKKILNREAVSNTKEFIGTLVDILKDHLMASNINDNAESVDESEEVENTHSDATQIPTSQTLNEIKDPDAIKCETHPYSNPSYFVIKSNLLIMLLISIIISLWIIAVYQMYLYEGILHQLKNNRDAIDLLMKSSNHKLYDEISNSDCTVLCSKRINLKYGNDFERYLYDRNFRNCQCNSIY